MCYELNMTTVPCNDSEKYEYKLLNGDRLPMTAVIYFSFHSQCVDVGKIRNMNLTKISKEYSTVMNMRLLFSS